jgi:hypothetical protein
MNNTPELEYKPPFNPEPTYPFAPGQLEVFCFVGRHGFLGIAFEMVQGFMACADEPEATPCSWVFVEDGTYHYEAIESVPELVARYADMKRRRAERDCTARKVLPPAPTTTWKGR